MPLLDLTSDSPWDTPPRKNLEKESSSFQEGGRRFVGIKFNCCGVYVRVYVNRDGTAYEGRCPKCFKPVKLKIGEGGTDHRFFEAY